MERLIDFLRQAVQMDGSDVFIIPGSPVETKRNGQLTPLSEEKLTPAAAEELIGAAYELAGRRTDALEENGDRGMKLLVETDNLPAVRLYAAMGFRKAEGENSQTAHWQIPECP